MGNYSSTLAEKRQSYREYYEANYHDYYQYYGNYQIWTQLKMLEMADRHEVLKYL